MSWSKFNENGEIEDALDILLISDNSREPVRTIIQRSANPMMKNEVEDESSVYSFLSQA